MADTPVTANSAAASGQVDPATLHPGLPVDREYTIFAAPALVAITAGATVRYTLLWDGKLTSMPLLQAAGSERGPGGDLYTWYKFADRSVIKNGDGIPLQRGVDDHGGLLDAPYWDCTWDEAPGRYVIGCRIENRARKSVRWCFYAQQINDAQAVLSPMLAEIEKNGLVHPDSVLGQQMQYISDIKADAARMPPATPELAKRHAGQLAAQEDYLAALRKKIEPWQDKKFFRVPVNAVHLSAVDQKKRKLNIYLVKTGSERAYEEIQEREIGWRKVQHPQVERWLLVDWTIPTNPSVCQEAEGSGPTDAAAIERAFANWNLTGNRYEPGWIQYSVSIKGIQVQGMFDTNGRTSWDTLTIGLNCLSTAAVAVIGVAALICPVPGAQVISFAMWSMIVSSTAAAGINIAQHLDEGSGTWQDHAIDGLTIVSNLLAGAGQIARLAGVAAGRAAWGEGAQLVLAEEASAVSFRGRAALELREVTAATAQAAGTAAAAEQSVRWFLIGQVASDATQGILVGAQYIQEYRDILASTSLTPQERVDRLLSWIGRAVLSSSMLFVSFRGAKKHLEAGKQENKFLKSSDGKPPAAGEPKTISEISKQNEVAPINEKLDRLGDKDAEITVRTRIPSEGNVEPTEGKQKMVRQVHKSTARTDMPVEPYGSLDKASPSAPAPATSRNPKVIALGLSTVKEKVTLPDGQQIEGVRDSVLSDFARNVDGKGKSAATWTSFEKVEDPNTGLEDFGAKIRNAMRDADEIHFNREGMTNFDEIANNPNPKLYKPPSTNWELATILSDPDLKGKTIFYDGPGKPIPKE